jgi:hypothetical protein
MLGERGFPHGDARRRLPRRARGLAKRGVPSRQGPAVPLKRVEIAARRQRQHDVEKAASNAGRPGDQVDVRRRKHHRGKGAECVAHALGNHAVDAYALALARALEPHAKVVPGVRLNGCGDVKSIRAETNEILIACTARRSQNLQIVDRLQQIRLPLAVVADHHQAFGGRRNLDVCEVAKVARDEADQSRR